MQQENDLSMPDMCHDYFSSHDLSAHKAEADVIYEQYLSEKVKHFILKINIIIS